MKVFHFWSFSYFLTSEINRILSFVLEIHLLKENNRNQNKNKWIGFLLIGHYISEEFISVCYWLRARICLCVCIFYAPFLLHQISLTFNGTKGVRRSWNDHVQNEDCYFNASFVHMSTKRFASTNIYQNLHIYSLSFFKFI